MNKVVINLLVTLLEHYLTPEVMLKAKVQLVDWLWCQAKSQDNALEESVVKALAEFLGVPVPA